MIQIVFYLDLTSSLLDHAFPNFVEFKFLLCEICKIEEVAKSGFIESNGLRSGRRCSLCTRICSWKIWHKIPMLGVLEI